MEKKLKLFKTKDSIAEFIELNTQNQELFTALDYQSFMRNQEDIVELKTSIIPPKRRFDFVIGNPPYIDYKECGEKGRNFSFRQLMIAGKFKMNNVYGVNINSAPNIKKNCPQRQIYMYFLLH